MYVCYIQTFTKMCRVQLGCPKHMFKDDILGAFGHPGVTAPWYNRNLDNLRTTNGNLFNTSFEAATHGNLFQCLTFFFTGEPSRWRFPRIRELHQSRSHQSLIHSTEPCPDVCFFLHCEKLETPKLNADSAKNKVRTCCTYPGIGIIYDDSC